MIEQETKSGPLSPDQQATIAKAEIEKIAQVVPAKIKTDAELAEANELLTRVRQTVKNVKAQKEPVIKGLNDQIRAIRGWFKPFEDEAQIVEKAIAGAILEYKDRVDQRAQRQAAKIEAKVDAGEITLSEGMGKLSGVKQVDTTTRSESGSTQVRVTRKARIVDAAALPASYFLRPRVLEALRIEVQDDVVRKKLPCPTGAEIYEEKGLAVSTNG